MILLLDMSANRFFMSAIFFNMSLLLVFLVVCSKQINQCTPVLASIIFLSELNRMEAHIEHEWMYCIHDWMYYIHLLSNQFALAFFVYTWSTNKQDEYKICEIATTKKQSYNDKMTLNVCTNEQACFLLLISQNIAVFKNVLIE